MAPIARTPMTMCNRDDLNDSWTLAIYNKEGKPLEEKPPCLGHVARPAGRAGLNIIDGAVKLFEEGGSCHRTSCGLPLMSRLGFGNCVRMKENLRHTAP
jgi:hypothetical protein